jgi:hypothetical protein
MWGKYIVVVLQDMQSNRSTKGSFWKESQTKTVCHLDRGEGGDLTEVYEWK